MAASSGRWWLICGVTLILFGLSAGVHGESFLFVDMGAANDQPATYIAIVLPEIVPNSNSKSMNHFAKEVKHFPLAQRFTLIPLEPGRYRLSHFDFTETIDGDHRTLHMKKKTEFEIHPNAVQFMGGETFSKSELAEGSIRRALTNLCTRFPAEASTLNEFYFLRLYDRVQPSRYRCDPAPGDG